MAYVPVNYDNIRYKPEPLERFAREAFLNAGLSPEHARELAGYLIATDLRGVLSHGTRQTPGYVQAFQSERYNPRPVIKILREAGATIQLDGDGGIGHLLAAHVMRSALPIARANGIALAIGVNCGHTGSIGNWTRIATRAGMIALFTSTAVSPTRLDPGRIITHVFGDYPFSMGFPAPPGEPPVVIDMGTLLDRPENQEKIAEISGLPLIKGLALQIIAMMLTMPLAVCHQNPAPSFEGATSSFTAIVIDPAFLGHGNAYHNELSRLRTGLRNMNPMPGFSRAVLPGDLEAEREVDFAANGIPLDPDHIEALSALAEQLGIPACWRESMG
jgi:LDH2 family malate/lactate/ureidoglycolate dehydrogenase